MSTPIPTEKPAAPAPAPAPPKQPEKPKQARAPSAPKNPRKNLAVVSILFIGLLAASAYILLPSSVTPPQGNSGLNSGIAGYLFAGDTRDYRLIGGVVTAQKDNDVYTATSGELGNYSIKLPAGTWSVSVKVNDNTVLSEDIVVSEGVFSVRELHNLAPELIPSGTSGSVRVEYHQSGWGSIEQGRI